MDASKSIANASKQVCNVDPSASVLSAKTTPILLLPLPHLFLLLLLLLLISVHVDPHQRVILVLPLLLNLIPILIPMLTLILIPLILLPLPLLSTLHLPLNPTNTKFKCNNLPLPFTISPLNPLNLLSLSLLLVLNLIYRIRGHNTYKVTRSIYKMLLIYLINRFTKCLNNTRCPYNPFQIVSLLLLFLKLYF